VLIFYFIHSKNTASFNLVLILQVLVCYVTWFTYTVVFGEL